MCAAESVPPGGAVSGQARVLPLVAYAVPPAVLAAGLLIELVKILSLNGGVFAYTLDDPYIHLAMAERIRHGFYGINPGEPAAPCSSILWPFLLVPFAGTALSTYAPLLLGALAAAGTVVIDVLVLSAILPGRPFLVAWGAVLLTVATNTIGLPFTGMEHSLQLLLTVSLLYGLFREAETERAPRWLVPVVALGPLVRYENLSLSSAAVVYLFLRGHRGPAFRAALMTLIPLVLFSAFLIHLGVGPLPASVVHKSKALAASSPLTGILSAWRSTLRDPTGVLLLVASMALVAIALRGDRKGRERLLAGCMTFAVLAHASSGGYGAYHRWEIYIVAATLLAVLWLHRSSLRAAADRWGPRVSAAMATGWCLVVASRYVFGLTTIPIAANNIFEQQYQMHRYVTQVERRPVVVNDIGFVSYRNPNYVLDLLGQGSEGFVSETGGTVRVEALRRAVQRRGIEVAMLYDEWFPVLLPEWRRIGELRLSRPKITPAFETVGVYATGVGPYEAALRRWQEFRATLPPRVAAAIGSDSTRAE